MTVPSARADKEAALMLGQKTDSTKKKKEKKKSWGIYYMHFTTVFDWSEE
jgi:hypothetical protein